MSNQPFGARAAHLCLGGLFILIDFFGFGPTLGQAQSLVLNELMADNQKTLADEA